MLHEWIDFFSQPTPIRLLSLYCDVGNELLEALANQPQLEGLQVHSTRFTNTEVLHSLPGSLADLVDLRVGPGPSGNRYGSDSIDFLDNLKRLDTLYWDPRVRSLDFTPVLRLTQARMIGIRQTRGMDPSYADLEWAVQGVRAWEKRRGRMNIPIFVEGEHQGAIRRDITGRAIIENLDEADPLGAGE